MFEKSIIDSLTGDSELTAITDNVSPISQAQSATRPYICYSITSEDDPSPSHDGPSGFLIVTYDIVAVADTYSEVALISKHTKRILSNYSVITDSLRIYWTRYDGETDIEQAIEDGTERPTYVRSQTYRAMYKLQ